MIKKLLTLTAIVASGLSYGQRISASNYHSLYICQDSTVKSFGGNTYGELGLGNAIVKKLPESISSISNVVAVASGKVHSIFLKSDGTVWATGGNFNGQLGIGNISTLNTLAPVQIQTTGFTNIIAIASKGDFTIFLKNDGTVWGCGRNIDGQLGIGNNIDRTIPVVIPGLTGVVAIAAGHNHSLF